MKKIIIPAAAVLIGLAGCTAESPRGATETVVSAQPTQAKKNPATVKILSGRAVPVKYLGTVFRTSYTLRNQTKSTADFLITFEYRDKSGVRIGQGVASVVALGPDRSARLVFDELGSDGFVLKDVRAVRVAQVQSWPTA